MIMIPYSALEIVSKLCDVDFARRAQAADFLNKAWEMLRKAGAGEPGGDKVVSSWYLPRSPIDQYCLRF